MIEPDYLAQTGEIKKPGGEEARAWILARKDEMREKQIGHARVSWSPEHGLILIEGWIAKPYDEGDPRFQLTAG